MRALAHEYEERAAKLGQGATIHGFLWWLEDLHLSSEDTRGEGRGADAVRVLTYHAAKGLEWPVVVCHSLHHFSQIQAFGVRVLGPSEVDLGSPLKDRRVRYWPWPFGKKRKVPGITEALEEVFDKAQDEALQEDLRLMYVGLTRARDILVLAHGKNQGLLDIPFNAGATTTKLPETIGRQKWSHGDLSVEVDVMVAPPLLPRADEENLPREYFEPLETPREHPPAFLQPSQLVSLDGSSAGRHTSYGQRLVLTGSPDMEELGNALHGFLGGDLLASRPTEVRRSILEAHLKRHNLDGCIDPTAVLAQAGAFREYIHRLETRKLRAEWPLFHRTENGQVVRGSVDLLAETGEGLMIIDHKTFPGKLDQIESRALEYSGQLDAYRTAVEATGKRVDSTWINFFVLGKMVEVVTAR